MNYSCVIVAAGSGSRTGLQYNKVFHEIDGKTVVERSAANFIDDPDCQQVIIVINLEERKTFEDLKFTSKVQFTEGGVSRQESVFNGLQLVTQEYVMIHDGARPFVSSDIIERIKEGLQDYNACVAMVKSTDTLKVVKNNIIDHTPTRETMYNAQTPQAFKTELIIESYKSLFNQNASVTDDAEAVEFTTGEEIFVVEGDYRNIKITTAEDLE